MKLFALLLFGIVACRDSASVKQARIDASNEADKHIDMIDHNALPQLIQTGTSIIFYGAVWCKFTEIFTPKFLAVQERVKRTLLIEEEAIFNLRKVECSVNEEFCTDTQQIEGYPTIVMYRNGIRVEDYSGEDEEEPFYAYVQDMIRQANQDASNKHSGRKAISKPAHLYGTMSLSPSSNPYGKSIAMLLTLSMFAIIMGIYRVSKSRHMYTSVESEV